MLTAEALAGADSGGGAVGGAGFDPAVHPAHSLGQRGGRAPAKLAGGPVRRNGAALQLPRARRNKLGVYLSARDLADDVHQVKDADLGARADVPGAGPAAVPGGEKGLDGVANI